MLPADYFDGTILLTVPHMDDCVLGCGGLLALLPDKARVYVCYVTDGAQSPAPVSLRPDPAPSELPEIRRAEGRAAMAFLGIAPENVFFLDLPDSRLNECSQRLHAELRRMIAEVAPDVILVPFRYDRHPDHIAINRVVTGLMHEAGHVAKLMEYFVYHHWKLLRTGDVRHYIRQDQLIIVDIRTVADIKRAALDFFTSQTTLFYNWQTRPNLTQTLLDDVSHNSEMFLPYDPTLPGITIFSRARWWIPLAHRLEPMLKKYKDQVVALVRRRLQG